MEEIMKVASGTKILDVNFTKSYRHRRKNTIGGTAVARVAFLKAFFNILRSNEIG